MFKQKEYGGERKNAFLMISKAVGLSVIITLLGILIFSLVLQFTPLSETVIRPVNQFIKVISVFFGCYFSLSGEKGFLKGGAAGLIYTLLTFLLFAFFQKAYGGAVNYVIDAVFGTALGMICGAFAVNIRKNV